ncbi:nitroreductase [Novosphingobium sp. HII-3]|uniref:nitroreductase n=1 Tax=Novosphingobium sp. HII-3 TaxID=2075565 RepID=UPI000CDB5954|nr:nitroreductase [Novosphingobium sp. HII-3]
MNVSEAVSTRRSVRGFLDKPVDMGLLQALLRKASAAPSGGNIQPWHIHVVSGNRLTELKRVMTAKVIDQPAGEGSEYDIYPRTLDDPYRARTFQIGEALYTCLGIPREDKAARAQWFARNFQCFGAPVALFCYVDRAHGPPQWSDLGMYLQTLMLLLREEGLDSCAQECWALYPRTLETFLQVPPAHMLFTGMSIGWKDEEEPANGLVAQRAPLSEFVRFHQ